MKDSLFSLQGKSVLITGAVGYLEEICFGLAESGAHVLVNSHSRSKRPGKLVNQLTLKGFSAEAAVFDVTVHKQVDSFFERYSGPLHVIINNAYAGVGGTIETSTSEQYTSAYAITIESAHHLFQRALPCFKGLPLKSAVTHPLLTSHRCTVKVSPNLGLYSTPEGFESAILWSGKSGLDSIKKD
ncbi:SDR family NAD(P)-dependent oxidoreductase [Vibrio lentus]|nr:SDR family NAD(P)-dependent oxidoreductase [Vibrio lentus]